MVKIKPGEKGYAEPLGLTKERGDKAKKHIYREIIDLVRNIWKTGSIDNRMFIIFQTGHSHVNSLCQDDEVGNRYCTFKQIFDRYVKISDKGN